MKNEYETCTKSRISCSITKTALIWLKIILSLHDDVDAVDAMMWANNNILQPYDDQKIFVFESWYHHIIVVIAKLFNLNFWAALMKM